MSKLSPPWRTRFSWDERWKQVRDNLYRANGQGLSLSDLAARLGLSRKRTHEILERMFKEGSVAKCKVEGSHFPFGMMLYFHPHYFEKIAGIKFENGHLYTLRQKSIFELIGE